MSQMKCIKCTSPQVLEGRTDVLHTRVKEVGLVRKHDCKDCREKFLTLELPFEVLTALVQMLSGGNVMEFKGALPEAWATAKARVN